MPKYFDTWNHKPHASSACVSCTKLGVNSCIFKKHFVEYCRSYFTETAKFEKKVCMLARGGFCLLLDLMQDSPALLPGMITCCQHCCLWPTRLIWSLVNFPAFSLRLWYLPLLHYKVNFLLSFPVTAWWSETLAVYTFTCWLPASQTPSCASKINVEGPSPRNIARKPSVWHSSKLWLQNFLSE